MSTPLVSVIVPTKNSAGTLGACLESIRAQDYPAVEIVVVDNHSTDSTLEIAKGYTEQAFTKGPERSAQRNFAVDKASGEYVLIIDSDMELGPKVVSQCVTALTQPGVAGALIPEESFGIGFWAACKRLERSFYVGVPWMQAARGFSKKLYQQLGGYNPELISGEDWDLSQRAGATGKLVEIKEFIRHNEGQLSLKKTLQKKFYYATKFAKYQKEAATTASDSLSQQTGVVGRYMLFLRKPGKLFANPVLGVAMLAMKTLEFGAGAAGILWAKRR